MKFLIVGLGNVGEEYAHTRHNIGFDVVGALVSKYKAQFFQDRLAYKTEIRLKGKPLICICPTTFMNLSGKALKYWTDKEKIDLVNVMVILDEVALPLSRIRIRSSGSSGGHNGLKSIEEALGTVQYPRLRFGIGNDYPKGMQSDFVLGKWRKEEEPLVKLKIDKSVEAIETFVSGGIQNAMNLFNNMEFTL